jgi:hypothetical protein
MFIPDPDLDVLPISAPGSRGPKGTESESATPVLIKGFAEECKDGEENIKFC